MITVLDRVKFTRKRKFIILITCLKRVQNDRNLKMEFRYQKVLVSYRIYKLMRFCYKYTLPDGMLVLYFIKTLIDHKVRIKINGIYVTSFTLFVGRN